jgi:hypothetical protein
MRMTTSQTSGPPPMVTGDPLLELAIVIHVPVCPRCAAEHRLLLTAPGAAYLPRKAQRGWSMICPTTGQVIYIQSGWRLLADLDARADRINAQELAAGQPPLNKLWEALTPTTC